MANSFQRSAFRRKIIYAGLILGLFTVSIFWRGKLAVPFSRQVPAARELTAASVLGRAEALELRELDQGDPEILATSLRLILTGSRGVAVTALWWGAIEKQKRNEYHEFEILVQAVTKLQPNFITPWLYQSWNIAYNVSVEHDKLGDMYFYIARGIELLAEGDKVNTRTHHDRDGRDYRIGSPDIRHNISFYYQNKFSVSDKVNTLRSLMQVSCIEPYKRKAETLAPNGEVDMAEFRKFCEANPQLVRRLKTKLNCERPEEVVQFLADNDKVPDLFKNDTEKADPADQFPALPPAYPEAVPNEYTPESRFDDSFDAFHAARAWAYYALPLVPPSKVDSQGEPLPWDFPRPGDYDAFRYRMPRAPALVIFRQQGPRAQTYLADRLAKEGWFDKTTVWTPDDRSAGAGAWFPASGQAVRLAAGANSRAEWQKAADLWTEHGRVNAMVLSEARRADLENRAVQRGGSAGGVSDRDRAEAAAALKVYDQNRTMTNFPYFLSSAQAEAQDVTVQARQLLYEADQGKQLGRRAEAADTYRRALAKWRQVLETNPDFHRPPGANQTTVEESTFEAEMVLAGLVKELSEEVRTRTKATLAAAPAVSGPAAAGPIEEDVRQAIAEDEAAAQVAAERVMSTDPLLKPQAGTPRDAARRDIETALAARSAAERSPAADRRAAQDVIQRKYAWMKEFKYEPKEKTVDGQPPREAYWVPPDTREMVRGRSGTVRREGQAPAGAPAAAPAPAAGPG